ncbi:MAG: VanZ family protein [Candidatus Tenebribacter burtonii]|jgi:VanZ family protein|nr:VanZ family protein [Candidatus Tenebribacter burtonii]
MKKIKKNSYSPATNLILYTLLLVATPFLIVQNYLQQVIGMTSQLSFSFLGMNIPFIIAIATIFILILIIILRHKITIFRIYSIIVVIVMMILGQNSTDYYFNHKFYELQHNWHYIAYAIFSYIIYRYLKQKKYSSKRIILYTFISASFISIFDEAIQILISNRIFDVCDIAKDIWGSVIGMIVIFFVVEQGKIMKKGWRLRQKKISDYIKNPLSLLFLEMIFAYLLLLISSILSHNEYLGEAILFSFMSFVVFFFIFHNLQRKKFRLTVISFIVTILLLQTIFFIKYHNSNIVYNRKGMIVYKGIPIPYFDIMIFPDGTFRLVDKKIYFNQKDKVNRIFKYANDILLIGSGENGEGGMGFIDEQRETQFIFNSQKKLPLQVIVLKTPDACKEFNLLNKKGYDVMFIIHN